jgi:hypothetical protein
MIGGLIHLARSGCICARNRSACPDAKDDAERLIAARTEQRVSIRVRDVLYSATCEVDFETLRGRSSPGGDGRVAVGEWWARPVIGRPKAAWTVGTRKRVTCVPAGACGIVYQGLC